MKINKKIQCYGYKKYNKIRKIKEINSLFPFTFFPFTFFPFSFFPFSFFPFSFFPFSFFMFFSKIYKINFPLDGNKNIKKIK